MNAKSNWEREIAEWEAEEIASERRATEKHAAQFGLTADEWLADVAVHNAQRIAELAEQGFVGNAIWGGM